MIRVEPLSMDLLHGAMTFVGIVLLFIDFFKLELSCK